MVQRSRRGRCNKSFQPGKGSWLAAQCGVPARQPPDVALLSGELLEFAFGRPGLFLLEITTAMFKDAPISVNVCSAEIPAIRIGRTAAPDRALHRRRAGLGLSRQQVRQIEQTALGKLRQAAGVGAIAVVNAAEPDRASADAITDANKYARLARAQNVVLEDLAARVPQPQYSHVAYGSTPTLTTTDNQVFTFGNDVNSEASFPIGKIGRAHV